MPVNSLNYELCVSHGLWVHWFQKPQTVVVQSVFSSHVSQLLVAHSAEILPAYMNSLSILCVVPLSLLFYFCLSFIFFLSMMHCILEYCVFTHLIHLCILFSIFTVSVNICIRLLTSQFLFALTFPCPHHQCCPSLSLSLFLSRSLTLAAALLASRSSVVSLLKCVWWDWAYTSKEVSDTKGKAKNFFFHFISWQTVIFFNGCL